MSARCRPAPTQNQVEQVRRMKSCRGCGYCMPCTVGIQINDCARMSLLLRRAPLDVYLTEEWNERMKLIEKCKHCNACREKCPYGLDTPALLEKNYADFKEFWAKKQAGEL